MKFTVHYDLENTFYHNTAIVYYKVTVFPCASIIYNRAIYEKSRDINMICHNAYK